MPDSDAGNSYVTIIVAGASSYPRLIDFERMRQLMARPLIFDGRNLYDPVAVRKAGLTFDRGIGFQLQSGARISIKRKDGRPMVYYRTSF